MIRFLDADNLKIITKSDHIIYEIDFKNTNFIDEFQNN